MQNLVILSENNEPVTTSLIIAQAVKYQHHTVITLIRKYLQELEQFGPIEFQILSGKDAQGHGKDGEMAILNEQQTYLLIMLMRNNRIVTSIKMRFVSAFFEMRKAVQNQQKQLEHHIPTEPELKAIYEQGRKYGNAQIFGLISTNSLKDKVVIDRQVWEKLKEYLVITENLRHELREEYKQLSDIRNRLSELQSRMGFDGFNICLSASSLLEYSKTI